MKILRVRGRNLASLPEFDLDFGSGPIGSAGIFAITGPTGSGKSTILDAICLALFDRLPRLVDAEARAMIVAGDADPSQAIKYNDVRMVLRHGCTSAFAEVHFVGRKGRTYRARWSVRRARDRADGKLQEQKLQLVDIENEQLIGQGKSDTLREIQERVGLTFDQFRRAVLLAQGEFDGFIRAKSHDRAELLQRITGTEIYTRISIEAHRRAKADQEAAAAFERELSNLRPLSEEERGAISTHLVELRSTEASLRSSGQLLRNAQRWHAEDAELQRLFDAAKAAWHAAADSDTAAEPQRQLLTRARFAFSVRSEIEAADKARQSLEKASQRETEARSTYEQAAAEAKAAGEREADTKRLAMEADRAYAEIGPQLTRATQLDASIAAAKDELDRRARARADATTRKRTAQIEDQNATRALRANEQRSETARVWLREHASWSTVADRLEQTVTQIGTWFGRGDTLNRLEFEIGTHRQRLAAIGDEEESTRTERDSVVEREQTLMKELERIRDTIAGIDRVALQRRREVALQWLSLNDRRNQAEREIEKSEAEIASQQETIETARSLIASSEATSRETAAALDEARRSFDLDNAAMEEHAGRLRALLIDGDPCPVCGATEHPTHEIGTVLQARLERDRARVEQLDAVSRQLTTQHATAKANETNARNAIERLRADGVAARRSLDEVRAQQIELRDEVGATDTATLRQQIDDITTRLSQLDGLEKARNAVSNDREAARREIAGLDQKLVTLRSEADALSSRLQQLEQNRIAVRTERSSAEEQLDATLRDAVAGWAHEHPDELLNHCRTIASAWSEHIAERNQLADELPNLKQRVGQASTALAAANQNAEQRDTEWNDHEPRVAALVAERAAVIGGREVDVVRKEHHHRFEAARTEAQDAANAGSAARTTEIASQAAWAAAEKQRHDCEEESNTATTSLTARLASLEIDLAFAREVIVRGEGALDADRQRLAKLRDVARDAEIVMRERNQSLAQHREKGTPDVGATEVNDRLTQYEDQLDATIRTLHEREMTLAHDDGCRGLVMDLQQRWQLARNRGEVSARLAEVIGSADGAKFRAFAQSLTFQTLVVLANQQLQSLHRRFELRKTEGDELSLQVIDRHMGDEVRGVHSLSGGERFLVSLALALGLATMSSSGIDGMNVESLFIDEGFGALDSHSLSVALSALEQLHARGRQIGVISHIEGLQERLAVSVQVTPEGPCQSRVEIISA